MRKLFYILIFAVTSSMVITSCTEEEVTPSTGENGSTTSPDPLTD